MKYLKSNSEVIFDSLRIDESMFYMSPKIREKLYKMSLKGINIATDLLSVQGTNVKPDITFIDSSDKEGFITFTQVKKAEKLFLSNKDDSYKNNYNLAQTPSSNLSNSVFNDRSYHPNSLIKYVDDIWDGDYQGNLSSTGIFTKGRNQVKIGKLVNKIFPGKYSDKEIEDFVNLFKSSSGGDSERFELVSGDDIEYWYSCDNYYDDNGTLGSSCMRKSRGLFDIYTENPDVCQMLILIDNESDKLLGRSLVWKPKVKKYYDNGDSGGKGGMDDMVYFMDRVYTSKDSDVNKFHEYAEKNGWGRKTYNNYSSHRKVTYKGNGYVVDMSIGLSSDEYNKYPYMDTFTEFLDGTLFNNDESDHGGYTLTDTNGGYAESNMVWSDYESENIPEDESVWSDPLGSYIYSYNSTYVEVGSSQNRGYYPQDHSDITWLDYMNEYANREDCVYSEMEDEYILEEDAVGEIIYDLNFTRESWNGRGGEGSVYNEGWMKKSDNGDKFILFDDDFKDLELVWFKILNDSQWNDDYQGIHMNLLRMDYNDSPILDAYNVTTFGTKDMNNRDFLTIEDWKLLKGVDISEKFDREDYISGREDEFYYMSRTWLDNDVYKTLDEIESGKFNVDIFNVDKRKSEIIDFLTHWFDVEIEEITERKILKFNSFLSK